MTDYYNDFSNTLSNFKYKHDLSRVFNDLLTISICSFHQVNLESQLQKQDEENEDLYLNTIKPYPKEDLHAFGQALGILQLNVLKDPYSDILGEYFMQHITRGQNGQYFTPDPICEMMAKMSTDQNKGKRILDPACGSGRMLLNTAKCNHRNYFFGADNTDTCAKMSVLNFFLNGMTGEVAWMNSLTMEWYGGWKINEGHLGILPISKEHSSIWNKPTQTKVKPSSQAVFPKSPLGGQQLSFF